MIQAQATIVQDIITSDVLYKKTLKACRRVKVHAVHLLLVDTRVGIVADSFVCLKPRVYSVREMCVVHERTTLKL